MIRSEMDSTLALMGISDIASLRKLGQDLVRPQG